MTIWIIEPHDPLLVRDGRPFSATPSVQAESLPFPFPSTTTGGVRTRAGLNTNGAFVADKKTIDAVKEIKVRGPLLVQLPTEASKQLNWLLPAPADVLILEPESAKEKHVLQQLVPLIFEGAMTDFDDKKKVKNTEGLQLVGPEKRNPRKPSKEAPHYWYWYMFEQWLINPASLQNQNITLSELGHNGPQREHRTHVSMEQDQRVAKEGALFGTSGLEFTVPGIKDKKLQEAQQLALVVAIDESKAKTNGLLGLREGIASLGGERRMVSWRKSNDKLPQCPQKVVDAIIHDKACRIILLTPAYFAQGYRPTWLMKQQHGVTPQLAGIAIQRPQIVSGWDLEKRGPKPTRRIAPAGTVIFLNLKDNEDAVIREWVNNMWMQCVSDDDPNGRSTQSRDDGFGLAVLGTWSGQPVAMKEQ